MRVIFFGALQKTFDFFDMIAFAAVEYRFIEKSILAVNNAHFFFWFHRIAPDAFYPFFRIHKIISVKSTVFFTI